MKRFSIIAVLFLALSSMLRAQTGDLRARRLIADETIRLRGYSIDTIANDTTGWIGKVKTIPTAKAVYDFVTNRIAAIVISGGSTTFAGLTDVNLTTLSTGQLVKYNGITGKWENFTPAYLLSVDTSDIPGFYSKVRSLFSATYPISYSNGIYSLDTSVGNWRSENYYKTLFTPLTRSISTGYGLTGGGDLSANRTLVFDSATAFTQIRGFTWGLSGNAGTSPGTNYIGTRDAQNLQFRTNGTLRFYIKSSGMPNASGSLDSVMVKIGSGLSVNAIGLMSKGDLVRNQISLTTKGFEKATWNTSTGVLNSPRNERDGLFISLHKVVARSTPHITGSYLAIWGTSYANNVFNGGIHYADQLATFYGMTALHNGDNGCDINLTINRMYAHGTFGPDTTNFVNAANFFGFITSGLPYAGTYYFSDHPNDPQVTKSKHFAYETAKALIANYFLDNDFYAVSTLSHTGFRTEVSSDSLASKTGTCLIGVGTLTIVKPAGKTSLVIGGPLGADSTRMRSGTITITNGGNTVFSKYYNGENNAERGQSNLIKNGLNYEVILFQNLPDSAQTFTLVASGIAGDSVRLDYIGYLKSPGKAVAPLYIENYGYQTTSGIFQIPDNYTDTANLMWQDAVNDFRPFPVYINNTNCWYVYADHTQDGAHLNAAAEDSVARTYEANCIRDKYVQVNNAQWTSSGDNANRVSGNVGIGTASPTALLHINGAAGFRYVDGNQAANKFLKTDANGVGSWSSSLSGILTNGNGTTANGSAVDLGGNMGSNATITENNTVLTIDGATNAQSFSSFIVSGHPNDLGSSLIYAYGTGRDNTVPAFHPLINAAAVTMNSGDFATIGLGKYPLSTGTTNDMRLYYQWIGNNSPLNNVIIGFSNGTNPITFYGSGKTSILDSFTVGGKSYFANKVGIGKVSPDSLLHDSLGVHIERGIRAENLPSGKKAKQVFWDTDGTFYVGDSTGTGGSGGVTGSGAANRISYWSSSSALTSKSGFEFDPATDILSLPGGGTLRSLASTWLRFGAPVGNFQFFDSGDNSQLNVFDGTGAEGILINSNGRAISSISGGNISIQPSGGNVGIGSSSPNTFLHVKGSSSWTSNIGTMEVEDGSIYGAGINFNATGSGGNHYLFLSSANSSSIGGGKFAIYNVTNNNSPLTIDGTGNIGIGVTSPTSNLQTTSFATGYVAKAVDYTVTINDCVIEVTATGKTITLPTAVGITGRFYTVKLTASGSGTVATTSSQTIDGVTTYTLNSQWKYVTIQSNGANWIITSNN